MADYIDNILRIKCRNTKLRNHIKLLIFTENDRNEPEFTMKKLLPMPEGFSYSNWWEKYGYNWSYAIWGTKWIRGSNISESGDTISVSYDTPWTPNHLWVEALCRCISEMINSHDSEVKNEISVIHIYYDFHEDLGDVVKWTPDTGFNITENVNEDYLIKNNLLWTSNPGNH